MNDDDAAPVKAVLCLIGAVVIGLGLALGAALAMAYVMDWIN